MKIRLFKLSIQPIIIFALMTALLSCNNKLPQNKELISGFRDPSNETKPRTYWNWLNGDVTLTGITRDLEKTKNKRLGGLQM